MARHKQTTPLQRAPSSQLMHIPPEERDLESKQLQNGNASKSVVATGKIASVEGAHDSVPETPGLMQLAICVLGIYASLCVELAPLINAY